MVRTYDELKAEMNKDVVLILSPKGSSGYRPPAGANLIPLTKAQLITCSSHYVHTSEHHESAQIRRQFFDNNIRGLFAPDLDWFKGADDTTNAPLGKCISKMKAGKSIACISQIREESYGGEYKSKSISKEDYQEIFQLAIRNRWKLVLIISTEETSIPNFLRDPHRPEPDGFHNIGQIVTRQASKIIAKHYGSKYGFVGIPSWIYNTPQPICNEVLIKDIADSGRSMGCWPVSPLEWWEVRAKNANQTSPFNKYMQHKIGPRRLVLNSYKFWNWLVKTNFPRRNHNFWNPTHQKTNALGLEWMGNILD
jgi:hypothetical protein